jgi:hypothetical protein
MVLMNKGKNMKIMKYSFAVASVLVFSSVSFAEVPRLLGDSSRGAGVPKLLSDASEFKPVNQGVYLGVNAGYADLNVGFNAPADVTVTDEDEQGIAAGAFGGVKFSENWALEIGYNYLPKYKNKLTSGGVTVSDSTTVYQAYAAGKAMISATERFNLFIKLGAAYNHATEKVSDGSTTVHDTSSVWRPYGAVGIGFLITPHIEATLQASAVTDHSFVVPFRMAYGSLGVSYIFG